MNHVVYADPNNQQARELQAAALTQMGYQAESGPWRNFYLSGAKELRDGVKKVGTVDASSFSNDNLGQRFVDAQLLSSATQTLNKNDIVVYQNKYWVVAYIDDQNQPMLFYLETVMQGTRGYGSELSAQSG